MRESFEVFLRSAHRRGLDITPAELEAQLLANLCDGYAVVTQAQRGICSFFGIFAKEEDAYKRALNIDEDALVVLVTNGLLDTNSEIFRNMSSLVDSRREIEELREENFPELGKIKFEIVPIERYALGERGKPTARRIGIELATDCMITLSDTSLDSVSTTTLVPLIKRFLERQAMALAYQERVLAKRLKLQGKSKQTSKTPKAKKDTPKEPKTPVAKLNKQYGNEIAKGSPVILTLTRSKEVVPGVVSAISATHITVKKQDGSLDSITIERIASVLSESICSMVVAQMGIEV